MKQFKMNKKILIFCSLLSAFSVNAQKVWTLKDCIDYATENNIDIKSKVLELKNAKIELNTSRMSRLPNLNANANENLGFGRSTSRDGRTVDNTSSSTNLGVYTSIPVFTGFQIPNQIRQKKFNVSAAIEDLNKAKEDLALNITGFYLQTLLYKELFVIAQEQIELDKKQIEQTEILVKSGKKPISELFEAKATLANNEVTLTENKNNVMLSLLNLSQLLNYSDAENFDIESPDISAIFLKDLNDLESANKVYSHSISLRPSIKAAQFRLKSSVKGLHIAKAQYYPTLNFEAGYNNGYYYNFNLEEGVKNIAFSDQIKNNGSEYLGVSLSIPIFNRFTVRNQVRQSRLNIEQQKLQLDNAHQILYKEIQQAYFNAVASEDKFKSAEKSVEASQIAFTHEETKYLSGKSTVLEYNNARLRLERSLSEEAQAKYDYIFRIKILDFYNGIPLYDK